MGDNKKLSAVWNFVSKAIPAILKISAVILVFLLLNACSKEAERERITAEEAKMQEILNDLEETGNIEGYGNYEDGIYVKIPYERIKQIELYDDESGRYEEIFIALENYKEQHEGELSAEELESFDRAISFFYDVNWLIREIRWNIPYAY